MKVSVIIPTYNGAQKLPIILKALEQQSFGEFDTLVVIDGSTDNSLEMLNKGWKLSLKVIMQDNKGRSAVRNRGALEAGGDLLIFFDDDMLPDPRCVERHVTHHLENKDCILTGAQIDYNQGVSDFQLFKNYLSRKWSKRLIRNQGVPLPEDQLFLTGANFSIAKKLFQCLGGFEEQLTDTEDFDLAVRAHKKGVQLYYSHEAFAWHNDKVTGRSYIKRLREYYRSNQKLVRLRPWLSHEGWLKLPTPPKGFKKYFFIQFCSDFWIKQLDDPTIVAYFPERIRYKIYSYIVTANGVFFPDRIIIQ